MRGVIWLVLLFGVAVVAATTLGSNDGLVSIYWSGWRTDVSLNLALLSLVVTFAVLALATQALVGLLGLPKRAQQWRELRRERAAHAALREALAEYFAARFNRARRSAQRALDLAADTPALRSDADFRTLGHLLAAGSLHRLQDRALRDERLATLQQAQGGAPPKGSAQEGAALLAIEWLLDDRDADQAARRLGELPAGVARRTQALRMRLQVARLQRNAMAALHTARQLSNHQALSKAAAQGLLRTLAYEALDDAHDIDQLRRTWQQFDAADRRDPLVAVRAASCALAMGMPEEARGWLRPLCDAAAELEPQTRSAVALALADAAAGAGTDWLVRVEAMVSNGADDPAVLLAAGTVYRQRQLYGKAQQMLTGAAQHKELPARARRQALCLLADLARQGGDEAAAQAYEREAARL